MYTFTRTHIAVPAAVSLTLQDGGHSGEGGRLKQYEEVVLEYVFLLSCFAAQNRPVTEAGAMVA